MGDKTAPSPSATFPDSYAEALRILRNALAFGIEPSLEGITALTRRLGNPQLRYPCIQIAGTNGKSSTARFTAAILRAEGKKVGLYTSPELTRYPECIEIDGRILSDDAFARVVKVVHEAAQHVRKKRPVTEFELLTAAAFVAFAQERVDLAVIEAGMGGQWDATNVVDSVVSVITGVGFEHVDLLGPTLEQIACNKAGVIKPNSVTILGEGTLPMLQIFVARAQEVGTQVHFARVKIDPSGSIAFGGIYGTSKNICFTMPTFQAQNAVCAVLAAEAMLKRDLAQDLLQETLNATILPGRFEVVSRQPVILIDAAHNTQSACVLADEVINHFGFSSFSMTKPLEGSWALMIGILKGKDVEGILEALLPLFDWVIVTQSTSVRSIPCNELAQTVRTMTDMTVEECPSLEQALERVYALGYNTVITGSITVAGEARHLLGEQNAWLVDY
jgi:dihydrofolate synthase/folylpolyglutamate synthase